MNPEEQLKMAEAIANGWQPPVDEGVQQLLNLIQEEIIPEAQKENEFFQAAEMAKYRALNGLS